jgi:DNA-directed RNA polymerase specialized sigma24 family protein
VFGRSLDQRNWFGFRDMIAGVEGLESLHHQCGTSMAPTTEIRLSELSTHWSLIALAHAEDGNARDAQAELLPRYCAAVYRHLIGLLREEAAVEEVCQEFAYRFVRGDFRHVRPDRGRFRDYLKVAIMHLVGEYRRKKKTKERLLPFDSQTMAATPTADTDAEFRDHWRRELLNRTWSALRLECEGVPPTLYDVLRRKADVPELPQPARIKRLDL